MPLGLVHCDLVFPAFFPLVVEVFVQAFAHFPLVEGQDYSPVLEALFVAVAAVAFVAVVAAPLVAGNRVAAVAALSVGAVFLAVAGVFVGFDLFARRVVFPLGIVWIAEVCYSVRCCVPCPCVSWLSSPVSSGLFDPRYPRIPVPLPWACR